MAAEEMKDPIMQVILVPNLNKMFDNLLVELLLVQEHCGSCPEASHTFLYMKDFTYGPEFLHMDLLRPNR